MSITIVGLGPGDVAQITRAAWELIQATDVLYLRTIVHPIVPALPNHIVLRSFDVLYERAQEFGEIYERIASELIERACAGEAVIYAVPGHPLVAEASTRHLLARAGERQLNVQIVPGMSFIEPVCVALGLDPLAQGLQLIDALDLVISGPDQGSEDAAPDPDSAWSEMQGIGPYTPALCPFPILATRPALICQLYSRPIASHVKLSLMERYPANHPITLVRAAGVTGEEQTWSVPLHELDHQEKLDHLTCAYVPALAVLEDLRSVDGVTAIAIRLLGPSGCPWDREQTHASLRANLLEETHEVLEAIDLGDSDGLAEELGDLLLQILLHSEMARQAGEFDLGSVYEHIGAKLIRRHPHVFGDLSVSGSGEVLRNWDAIKREERAAKGQEARGALAGIPKSLPALASAQELTHKAAKVAFDWPDLQSVWDKLTEEIKELEHVAQQSIANNTRHERQREEELGDVLFALTNLARWLHIDAESALRVAEAKFRLRFAYVEEQAHAQGRELQAMSAAEKIALWKQAKDYDQ